MTIQANQGFGVSIFGATSAGGGGSTSPGGSSGQLQYNASGSFGGMAGTSWDDTNRSLTLTGATVTTSQPVLNLSQTWNAAGVTFTGLKFNATDSNSASGSLLLDLQVGGTSQFGVSKSGVVSAFSYSGATGGYSTIAFHGNANSSANAAVRDNVGFTVRAANVIGWVSNTNAGSGTVDLSLTRAAAATLQLGAADAAAPVAQTLQVQSVVAGTSNTAGANWTLKGSAGTGTGAGGSIIFQVAPAGSSGTAQNAYQSVLSLQSPINAASSILTIGPSSTSGVISAGSNNFGNIQFGGVTYGANGHAAIRNDGSVVIRPAGGFSWASTIDPASGTIDLSLFRDAANTLALRNGTNAQTFNVYNTYTDASNYERGALAWTSNAFRITTSAAGTGTSRNIALQSAGGAVDVIDGSGNSQINFTTTTSTGIRVASDRPIGFTSGVANGSNPDTTLRRVGVSILGVRGGAITDAGALSFIEQTAPAAPAANGVYIYAEDNGSGKTRLMALFNTGAAQQIAIEP